LIGLTWSVDSLSRCITRIKWISAHW